MLSNDQSRHKLFYLLRPLLVAVSRICARHFQVPYPLPKLDMLAAPDFAAGAMENWGLAIFREVDLLCNISTVGVSRKVRIATVVAHELSHMWFGNLVTMEPWSPGFMVVIRAETVRFG